MDVPYDAFWRNAGTASLLGRSLTTLALPDLLLAVCVHGSKHGWTRLKVIRDVAGLIEHHADLDVDSVLETARRHGLARIVLVGLGLARHVYGATGADPAAPG